MLWRIGIVCDVENVSGICMVFFDISRRSAVCVSLVHAGRWAGHQLGHRRHRHHLWRTSQWWHTSIDQTIERANNQSINQSIDRIKHQSINQSIDRTQFERQSINQSIDRTQFERQSINQSIDRTRCSLNMNLFKVLSVWDFFPRYLPFFFVVGLESPQRYPSL